MATAWFEETLHPHWRQGLRIDRLILEERTEHQDLVIFDNQNWGRVLTLDGVVQTTTGDEFCYHEMMVHVPLLAHGATAEVLIIGGGDGGCLREVLRHPGVRRATQVEIDRSVIDLSRQWLPTLSNGAFDDPRTRLLIEDGARFVADTAERFDVVIVDSTDPEGPAAVLFTEEFYRNCRRVLAPGGIMVTQCGNPSIRPEELDLTQRRQRQAGFAHVDYYLTVVPTYIGGAMALGFATDVTDGRHLDLRALQGRTAPSGLRYWTPEVHVASFAHPAWMVQRIGY